ncbi:hypothetical protein K2173_018310 [Erythroxylum novogranatense]|uniref:YGGT family protein n=1 Tax=Erythroxylum novogranatense TaxID=1862640 RepID=A0AAV8UET3_9ROSI|nr:hypothetical protein K2173_018310 [Erythroxylum novogranatense]
MAALMNSCQFATILRTPLPHHRHLQRHQSAIASSSSSSFTPLKTRGTPFSLNIAVNRPRVSASASATPTLSRSTNSQPLLIGSTRTVTTIATLTFSLSRIFLNCLVNFVQGISILPGSNQFAALQCNLAHSMGPLFFAALKDRHRGYLNTPLTVVAAGLAKWLDIYSGVLMVRVLLSWFPNIPWDRQPLSAIRDLCDPYLNLFRNIIPPIFDTLDVSPLLAFAVLGTLGSILNSSRGM